MRRSLGSALRDCALAIPPQASSSPTALVSSLLKASHQLTLRHVSLMQRKLKQRATPIRIPPFADCSYCRREKSDRTETPSRSASPGSFVGRIKAALWEAERTETARRRPRLLTSCSPRRAPHDPLLTRRAVRRIAAPLSRRLIPDGFLHCRRRVSISRLTLEEVLSQQKTRKNANIDSL